MLLDTPPQDILPTLHGLRELGGVWFDQRIGPCMTFPRPLVYLDTIILGSMTLNMLYGQLTT